MHDGIDTLTHTCFTSNFNCVNGIELQLFINNLFLHFISQVLPNFISRVRSVQEERSAFFSDTQNINFAHELELVTSHKVSFVNEVSRLNRVVRETQVRSSHRAGFTRVVNEVTLTIFTSVFCNNFNRVFVSTNGTISAQAEEYGTNNIFTFRINAVVIRQRLVCNVIVNTNGEAVNRFFSKTVVINSLNHARCKFFRRKAITTANDFRHRDLSVCGSLT